MEKKYNIVQDEIATNTDNRFVAYNTEGNRIVLWAHSWGWAELILEEPFAESDMFVEVEVSNDFGKIKSFMKRVDGNPNMYFTRIYDDKKPNKAQGFFTLGTDGDIDNGVITINTGITGGV